MIAFILGLLIGAAAVFLFLALPRYRAARVRGLAPRAAARVAYDETVDLL